MTVIDFHNHFYPPEYISALRDGRSKIAVSFDVDDNPVLHSPGDENVIVPGHRDIDMRQRVIEAAGIDTQVLTFTAPGTDIEPPARAVELARLVNDALAAIRTERPDRFTALATLPMVDPDAAVVEFDRVTSDLGLPGCMLFSNANGVALSDERFWPLYERASERNAVLYIHPTYPIGVEAMTDFWLMPLVGFTFDTTLAAAKLVFQGIPERYPGIRWVLGHLGGAIPYLAERLDRGYYAFADCRAHISRPPSQYLREFYYDTVNFDPAALALAVEFAGADHLLAGSDYPHQIGSIERMLGSLGELELSAGERLQVLGGTAVKLLAL